MRIALIDRPSFLESAKSSELSAMTNSISSSRQGMRPFGAKAVEFASFVLGEILPLYGIID